MLLNIRAIPPSYPPHSDRKRASYIARAELTDQIKGKRWRSGIDQAHDLVWRLSIQPEAAQVSSFFEKITSRQGIRECDSRIRHGRGNARRPRQPHRRDQVTANILDQISMP